MSELLKIIPKEIIRTETVLSRFPIHRLSKSGKVSIEIKIKNLDGELTTKWKVENPPDPISYKIDTLVINRRIEEAGKPVPKLIRLGSLNEISEELGASKTRNTDHIKNAIIQNVGAVISAKFTYKTNEGTIKKIDIADTRYGAIFTGEELPNGDKADATYILLHDIYREILNTAPTRPLDYDYLKELTPIAQRLYELLSYQIYGALESKRTTAKMLYSEFCTYAPQTRFFNWEQVRPQMYRVHKPHLESGYIESVSFKKQRSETGTPDWLFIYTPGQKAKGEHTFAKRKPLPKTKEIKNNPNEIPVTIDEPTLPLIPDVELTFTEAEEQMVSKILEFKVSEKKARELIKSHRQAVEREISVFPYRLLGGAVKSISGLFITAVEDGYEVPDSYLEAVKQAEAKKRFEADQLRNAGESEAKREERRAWDRANERINKLLVAEREELWAITKEKILSSPENISATPQQLKILESVLEGYIRSEIIELFIAEERDAAK